MNMSYIYTYEDEGDTDGVIDSYIIANILCTMTMSLIMNAGDMAPS
jgi:hypothetical protein